MGSCLLPSVDWYRYLIVSCITFFGGLLILVPARLIWYCLFSADDDDGGSKRGSSTWQCCSRVRGWAVGITSTQTRVGIIGVVFVFLCNMASIILYFIMATYYTRAECGSVKDDTVQLIYAGLCIIFAISYLLRFIAATDKLYFWVDIYSIVDHLTIGPFFFSLFVDSNWMALRFLRILYLLQISEILQMTHILKSSSSIRLAQILSIFIGVWFASAGVAQLIEHTAGVMAEGSRSNLGYWESIYWLLVTMSTVGYGEIYPNTDLGRGFILLYIICTFAMFATIVPELVTHVGMGNKFKRPYKRIYGKRHIIVCGHVNYDTITRFTRDFVHEDADNRNINVVFVDSNKPNLEMEAFFKRHNNRITFLQGSVMEVHTLRNAKVRDAEACLIMTNRSCADPDEEDGANTMRATAIKKYDGNARVIIQLLQFHNKTYLLHIPNWNWDKTNGDDVICISELKLGLMAQNCLARGICCLMSNLFTMRSYTNKKSGTWQDDYRYGAGNEIYIQTFSSAFVGLSFGQAAEICFTDLNVLLVAIQSDTTLSAGRMRINPSSRASITLGMRGFFLAQGPEDVRRVQTYTPNRGGMADANANDTNKNNIKLQTIPSIEESSNQLEVPRKRSRSDSLSAKVSSRHRRPSVIPAKLRDDSKPGDTPEVYDYTGMYHWCPARDLDEAIMDSDEIEDLKLHDHVVVCLLSDADSPLVGLTNFVMPLRTSNFPLSKIKDIVVLGDPEYLKKEWDTLANFPKMYVFNGSPSSRHDLRAIGAQRASMCVIMSAKKTIMVDSTMLDKEAILTNLNVQGMFGKDTEDKIRSLGIACERDEDINHNESSEIPITTELEIENNVAFLDEDDDDDPDLPLYLTHPYVSGTALASSCLDSLLNATFQNSHILTLVRALITGGETAELERILAEGYGIVRKPSSSDHHFTQARCRLNLLPLSSGPLAKLETVKKYGELFVGALRTHHILCLGVYRLMSTSSNTILTRPNKRFVITNPHKSLTLLPSDMIYCLQPSNQPSSDVEPSNSLPKKSHLGTIPASPVTDGEQSFTHV